MSHAQVQTRPKFRYYGYVDESDEVGRQTPSVEKRPLWAVVFVYLTPRGGIDFRRMRAENGGRPTGYLIDHRHACCNTCQARIDAGGFTDPACPLCRVRARGEHVAWAEARGMGHSVHYRILEIARVFGYKSKDEHGDHLYV